MDYIEDIKIDAEDDMLWIDLTGDFVNTFAKYIQDTDAYSVRLAVLDTIAFSKFVREAQKYINDYV